MNAQQTIAYRWVADDTEESVLGADWHQEAIVNLWGGLRHVARQRSQLWHVGNQLTLVAWHPDGTPWRPMPDIMVHPHAGHHIRHDMNAHASADGVPALIIEVVSRTTWMVDVGMDPAAKDGAKAFEYLALGVPEYLVFDPADSYVPGQCRGWQLVDGVVRDWIPAADGRYHSRNLDIAFRPEGLFLRIITVKGEPIPFNHEQSQQIVTLDQKLTVRERQIAESREENAVLRRQVVELTEALARLQRPDAPPDQPSESP